MVLWVKRMGKNWNGFADIATKGQTPNVTQKEPIISDQEKLVWYKGEHIQLWLALDLAEERAALLEYCEGLSRAEVEACAFLGLQPYRH